MEEDLEILERGLLSDVNAEYDLIFTEPRNENVAVRKMSKPATSPSISSKVLKYLGTVRVTTDFRTSNPKVWLLQSLLNELGYSLNLDGFFGQLTEGQVKKFQANNGLTKDGIVGQNTWNELIYQNRNRISNSKIGKEDFEDAANTLGVEVAVVKAVTQVESNGYGYEFSNHPRILFESHVFWKELKKRGVDPSKYTDNDIHYILNQTWEQGKNYYVSGVGEYARLQMARLINRDAADASASWGLFQIMGNNFAYCGCSSVSEFVKLMNTSEKEQLNLFVKFIMKRGLHTHLQGDNKRWDLFAEGYNGKGYKENKYDTKLETAYINFKDEQ